MAVAMVQKTIRIPAELEIRAKVMAGERGFNALLVRALEDYLGPAPSKAGQVMAAGLSPAQVVRADDDFDSWGA